MKGIKIVAPILDNSGYAQCAREFVRTLANSPLTIKRVKFEQSEYKGKDRELFESFLNKHIDYDVVLQFLTPNNFIASTELDKVNIGYCMWETDKLPEDWVFACNNMNMIIVPNSWNVKVFKDSGVSVPVECIGIPTDIQKFDDTIVMPQLAERIGDRKAFYSIFEWSERKNPKETIRAFYRNFDKDEAVLILKVKSNLNIEAEIKALKREVNRETPEIILISNSLTNEGMRQLHKTCDTYISTSRGEGWNIPLFDALLCGNQAVATNYSSHTDFMSNNLVDCVEIPVENSVMNNWYKPDQKWADIISDKLDETLRNLKPNESNVKDFSYSSASKKLLDIIHPYKKSETIHIFNPHNFGDCIFLINYLNRAVKVNDNNFKFYMKGNQTWQLEEFIEDKDRIQILPLRDMPSNAYNSWIGIDTHFFSRFLYKKFPFNEYYKQFFSRFSDVIGIKNPIETKEDIVTNSPLYLEKDYGEYDYLFINSIPNGVQAEDFSEKNFGLLDWRIKMLARDNKVITTRKVEDIPCTADLESMYPDTHITAGYHKNGMLSLLNIGQLATKAKNIIGINTGPMIATFSKHNLEKSKWLICEKDWSYNYNKSDITTVDTLSALTSAVYKIYLSRYDK